MNVALVLPETPSSFSCCCNFWKKTNNQTKNSLLRKGFPNKHISVPKPFDKKNATEGTDFLLPRWHIRTWRQWEGKNLKNDQNTGVFASVLLFVRKMSSRPPEDRCFGLLYVCLKDEFFFHHLCANEQIHSYRRFWMRPPVWIKNRSLL